MAIWQYDNFATISKAEEAQGAGRKSQGRGYRSQGWGQSTFLPWLNAFAHEQGSNPYQILILDKRRRPQREKVRRAWSAGKS
jgi:hypothetical protein